MSTRQIVPGAGLPPDLHVQPANNNLDVLRSKSRVLLAFRTAPTHYASAETRMIVVSTKDEEHWQHEATFFIGADLREPRLFSFADRVSLLMAELGSDPFAFEPKGTRRSDRNADGSWSPLSPILFSDLIPWRVREINGSTYLIGYRGGGNLYAFDGPPIDVVLEKTLDGRSFEPLDPARPVVARGGGSEADFAIRSDGTLYAVIRNEAGDADGWGSKLCRATRENLSLWKCRPDRRKFDSPNVFRMQDTVYFFARRNVTSSGEFQLVSLSVFRPIESIFFQLAYVLERKRCSLWRLDPDTLEASFVLDLPSRGDTCFPALLRSSDPREVYVYDYSSPLDGPDLPWYAGQQGETHIYRHTLRFTEIEREEVGSRDAGFSERLR